MLCEIEQQYHYCKKSTQHKKRKNKNKHNLTCVLTFVCVRLSGLGLLKGFAPDTKQSRVSLLLLLDGVYTYCSPLRSVSQISSDCSGGKTGQWCLLHTHTDVRLIRSLLRLA